MNVPGLGRDLFSGGKAALRGINTAIVKESYLDVGQFKISLRKDTICPTIDYLDLDLAPRGNYSTKVTFPTSVISGHTIPTGSALVSRRLRNGAMGVAAPLAAVARPFIATFTATPGLPAQQTTASAHGTRLISGSAMEAGSTSTETTSFAVPTITLGLVTATTTATPAMSTKTIAAAGSAHLRPAPGTSERNHLALAYRAFERAHHPGRVNIAETVVNFTDSLTACDIYRINNSTKQPIRNEPGKTEITAWLQLVSTNLLGPVTPAARGNYRFMAKCSDHYITFRAVHIITAKGKVLTTLIKFVQDFVIPLELRLQYLCTDGGGEIIAD